MNDLLTRPTIETDNEFDVVIEDVNKNFGDVPALKNVSLTVRRGEFVTLLGPSGCGKSTLLRIVTGLETQNSGNVYLAGQDMSGVAPHRRPVSLVFQNLALFPHMTVEENIAFPLRMAKASPPKVSSLVAEYLALIQLSGFEKRQVAELSGGQRQRVALARALAHQPKVLLLDEPLSALDEKLRKEMQVELKDFQSRMGTTFVYVTHDQEEALVMSDRVAVFSEGRIEQVGRPLDIYNRPSTTFVAEFVGETNLFECSVTNEGNQQIIDIELCKFALDSPSKHPIGVELYASLRPEHISVTRITNPRGDDGVSIEARVLDVLFYGSDVKVHVEAAHGKRIMARIPVNSFEAKLSPGEKVRLSWSAGAIAVVNTTN